MPRSDREFVKDSTWATLPAVLLGLAAIYLLVFHQHTIGYFLLACGIFAAWLCDVTTLSEGLVADLTAVATGIAILSLSDLSADLSDAGMLRFTIVLTAAVAVPYALLRWAFRRDPVVFPWGGWRWNRAQWTYLGAVVVVGYLVLPWYFISTGVYRNWPAIHDRDQVLRLFIGVNAVGIWDELFFVCTVFALYRRHFKLWQANLLQAMVFVPFLWELGYQSWGPLLTIPFVLVQGAIFQLTKNLAYVITVHLLFDLVVFLVLLHGHNPDWPHIFITVG
ncbi:type II CAAX prenyl endopeptidase Rce1 family protein [Micropruina sp.]|uniref:CPBP family glutamic-type intramembrane protease n=1 Tax=Micropruina sp. TaxID=2737536 RepID=UPI0039E6F748